MEIKGIYDHLMTDPAFVTWKEKNPSYYLAHFFRMPEDNQWQIGFYSKAEDLMVSFTFDEESFIRCPESEVFKKTGTELLQLEIEEIHIDWNEALDKANEIMKNDYPRQLPTKTFFILQKIQKGTVFNITFLTKSFHTINLKLSAIDGNLISQKCESLMDMASVEKGSRNDAS